MCALPSLRSTRSTRCGTNRGICCRGGAGRCRFHKRHHAIARSVARSSGVSTSNNSLVAAMTWCAFRIIMKAHHVIAATSRSEEHTSELQSLMRISYAVFCLKKKKNTSKHRTRQDENTNEDKSLIDTTYARERT